MVFRNIKIAMKFAVIICFFLIQNSSTFAQSCTLPTPVITTIFNSFCTIYTQEPNLPPHDCFQVCELSLVTYSVVYNPGSTYVWSIGGGVISNTSGTNGETITVSWGNAANGVVQVTETNGTCNFIVDHCITIIPKPDISFSTVPFHNSSFTYPLDLCAGENLYLLGNIIHNPSQNPIISWYWEIFDGFTLLPIFTSTNQYPHYQFSQAGTFTVHLTGTNECGCSDEGTILVNVSQDQTINIECPTPICEGETATYSVDVICPAPLGVYNWTVTPPAAGQIIPPSSGNTCTVHWLDGSMGPGVLNFSGINCNSTCNSVASISVPIITDHAILSGPTVVCNDNLQCEYSIPQMPGATYTWNAPYGTIINGDGTNKVIVVWDGVHLTDHIFVNYTNEFYDCGAGSTGLTVNIKPPFTVSGDHVICVGSNLTVTVSDNINLFNWELIDPITNTKVTSISNHP